MVTKFKIGDKIKVISAGVYPGTYLTNKDKIGILVDLLDTGTCVVDFNGSTWYSHIDNLQLAEDVAIEIPMDLETYLKKKDRGF